MSGIFPFLRPIGRRVLGFVTGTDEESDARQVFVGKGFAFVTFDYRCNAEVAKMQLSKVVLDPNLGPLDVRWAASNACVEVHGLGHNVSNEVR